MLKKAQQPQSFKALCQLLNYHQAHEKDALKARLRAMERDGQILFNKFKQYEVLQAHHQVTGKVLAHKDGFGFLALDQGGRDLFISRDDMQALLPGDSVAAVEVPSKERQGRTEARIVKLLKPREAAIVGRLYRQGERAVVVPEDTSIKQDIIIAKADMLGARQGQIVVVSITERPSKQQHAKGKVIEILGDHLEPGMEIKIALREHDLPHEWPQAVLDDVAQFSDDVTPEMWQQRHDLRDLPLVTIDGEDARDFDDAVYCEPKKSGGWRLWVAIADVSYYVRPNSPLDQEAIRRGNSVYFPSQVIPMLPEKLSNGLCSLNPNVDRLCFVCEMTVSAVGNLSGYKFYPAVMNSKARLTYTQVAAMLQGDESLQQQYASVWPHLNHLNELYQALADARQQRGAIEFDTLETKFIFNAERKIDRIELAERNDAHKIIEECMILANVATAKCVAKHQAPALYRVHDKPNEEKYQNFLAYLAELGINLPFHQQVSAQDYTEVVQQIAERPDKELIQTMLLRSMRQAVYQPENIGHFGLALPAYSHFTSPIRRYPDLVVHRVLKDILQQAQASSANDGHFGYSEQQVLTLGEQCSMTERRADDATRDVADWLKCEYMQDHVGDSFSGVISTVTSFGLFVRLNQVFIEGLVHITSLKQDYYHFDEKRLCLVGERSRQTFAVGDVVQVQVAAVNLDEKKIDLLLIDKTGSARRATSTKRAEPSSDKKAKKQHQGDRHPFSKFIKKSSKKAEKKVKNKDQKRKARSSRPGKNARKRAKQQG